MDEAQRLKVMVDKHGRRYQAYTRYRELLDSGAELDPRVHYWGLQALLRSGFILEALKRYAALHLEEVDQRDFRVFPGRLLKELYFQTGKRHRWMLDKSLRIYRAEYERDLDPFPGINAAFLAFIADDEPTTSRICRNLIAALEARFTAGALTTADIEPNAIYDVLTLIEARFLIGDDTVASEMLMALMTHETHASSAEIDNFLSQLKRIQAHRDAPMPDLPKRQLASVTRFCGEIFAVEGDDLPPETATRVASCRLEDIAAAEREIERVLTERRTELVVGALAAGGDLLVTEVARRLKIRLHAVLPSGPEDFRAKSIAPYGAYWADRFDQAMAYAEGHTYLGGVVAAGSGMAEVYDAASQVTMGFTEVLAESQSRDAAHLAVLCSTGKPQSQSRRDSTAWRKRGNTADDIVIPSKAPPPAPVRPMQESAVDHDQLYVATIFCDLVGASKLSEDLTSRVFEDLYQKMAETLAPFDTVLERNTWGDAVFLVLRDIEEAAEAALALRQFADEELADEKGDGTTFRIACHYGPAYKIVDKLRDVLAYTGLSVVKAARIEPITPPGDVYATQSFAGKLKFDRLDDRYTLELVGDVPLAKNYGSEILYSLRRKDFDLNPKQLAFIEALFAD